MIEKIEVYEDGRGDFRYRMLDGDGGNQGESGNTFGSEEAAREAAERRAKVEVGDSDRKVKVSAVTGEKSRKTEAAIAEARAAGDAGAEVEAAAGRPIPARD